MKFESKAIRIQTDRTSHREHSTPIFPTSSFVYDDVAQMQRLFSGEKKGNIYSRFTNPSLQEFEQKMAALEETEAAQSTATGMAAVFASFMCFLKSGDHILATRSIFGSTYQIINQTLPQYGIEATFVEADDIDSWEKAIQPNTRMLYLESPSNPGLAIVDLEKAGKFSKKHDLIFNVDNCFATPYLQQPAKFGADLIVHSATKFIDGQGRVLGGAVCGKKEMIDQIFLFIRRTGATLSPFNAWVLSKSLETLAIRMDRHCANAVELANWLQNQNEVESVNYPFHDTHPQFDLAKKQMRLGGGIVTFGLNGDIKDGETFLNGLNMISLTANLGDTRTIATHPASTTHLRVPEEERLKMGITNNLIRISVGLEHIDDIKADITNGFNNLR